MVLVIYTVIPYMIWLGIDVFRYNKSLKKGKRVIFWYEIRLCLKAKGKWDKWKKYYYNPFDPNYVSYLEISCNEADFNTKNQYI